MCLAIPGRLSAIDGTEGVIDYGGVTKHAELCLVPDARVGDRVLIHAGFAIAVLDEKAGDELELLLRETESFGAVMPASDSGSVPEPDHSLPATKLEDAHG